MSSDSIPDIEHKIAHYSEQIASFPADGSARAKKRIYQKLGKLKKDLIAAKDGKLVLNISDEATKGQKKRSHESDDELSEGEVEESTTNQQSKKKSKHEPQQQVTSIPDVKVQNKQLKPSKPAVTSNIQSENSKITHATVSNLSKKESKSLLHSLNHELVDCAIKKQLARAKKVFRNNEAKGLVLDVLTYTNLINVFVRCNDVVGAAGILEEMQSKAIEANTVTYTTMLKGYSEIGMLKEASNLFLQHMIPKAYWNIRSLSTFLRGCIRTGSVDLALLAFNTCYREQTIKVSTEEFADESACLEGIVGLLCRANRINEATSLVMDYVTGAMNRQPVDDDDNTTGLVLRNAGLYTILAKANALVGLFQDAKKYIELATKLIEEGDKATLRENMRKRFQQSMENSQTNATLLGDSKTEGSSTLSKSVELFLAHKRNDMRNQMDLVEEYMSAVQTIPSMKPTAMGGLASSVLGQLSNDDCLVIEACRVYAIALSQLLYFGFDGKSDLEGNSTDSREEVASSMAHCLVSAVKVKYGLQYLHPSLFSKTLSNLISTSSSHTQQRLSQEVKDFIDARVETMKQETFRRIIAIFDKDTGKIDFKKLFPDCSLAKIASSIKTVSNEREKPSDEKTSSKRHHKKKAFGKQKSEAATNITSSSIDGSGSGYMTGTMPKEYRKLLNLGNESDSSSESESSEDSEDDSDDEDADKKSEEIPIKLEIGSGNGDWIVAQAAADRVITTSSHGTEKTVTVRGNWIACELRNDRAHHIWSNHFLTARHLLSSPQSGHENASTAMKGGNNLAVLAGDASKIVKDYIGRECISSIFINYPQPPERVAGDHKNQGKHLLTHEFFCDMMTILKKKGTITILTDNLSYAQSLAQTVATMNKTARHSRKKTSNSADGSGSAGLVTILQSVDLEESEIERRMIQEYVPFTDKVSQHTATDENTESDKKKKGNKKDRNNKKDDPPVVVKEGSYKDSIIIWRGDPGDESGHIAMVSSYFDRMWSLGQKKRRWFLFLKKKQV
jgi:pentatricopeptide repeat protein